ncbi:MAG TPA: TRAP transporter small permease [Planctomycetota bacterium]|nr:TRAP transporter small permease [Planctomycetota bacterium]HRR80971.1 TRAP transporter small permease [Planctomycetota bacterium]HRT94645.1 TRAP transporter small permease [Planctomycetota bacterium]
MKLPRNVEGLLAGLLLAAVAVLLTVQLILARVLPGLASPITPIVLALFFWATLLGVPAATRADAHLSLGLVSRLASSRWRRRLQALGLAAALVFFLALAVAGVQVCWGQVRGHNRSLVTWCPDWVVTLCVPLAGALSCVRAIQCWRERRRASGREGREGETPPSSGGGKG